MMGTFRGDRDELGHRLRGIRDLGSNELGRRFVDIEPPVEARPSPAVRVEAGARRVGRPKIEGVRPWEAEGVSRAAYFRRKKSLNQEQI
jgi:hypothetical protein